MAPVRVSAAFDSGNIEVVSASDHSNVKLKIRRDPYCKHDDKVHFQWFHFRVSGCRGLDLTLHLVNAGESSFPEAWPGYRACCSYDTEEWFRIDTTWDEKAGTITMKHRSERDSLYIAYFAPYSLAAHQRLIAKAQCAPNVPVKLEILGHSVQGRDIDLLTIGEPSKDKRQIWIVARQHPGESMAEWFMEGLLGTLTNEHNAFSCRLLRKAVFYIIPNMNPDGSYLGHLRTNAKGANLNREWRDTTEDYSPEVFCVRNRMDELAAKGQACSLFLDIHGDEEIQFNFLAGSEGIPSWSETMAKSADVFKAAFHRATPDFKNSPGYGIDEPGKADLTIASNAVGERYRCMSFTLEQPFKSLDEDAPTSVHGWSPARAQDFGSSILSPIYEVLPLLANETGPAKKMGLTQKMPLPTSEQTDESKHEPSKYV